MKGEFAIASASWPDHLVFGEGDGRLDTPDGLKRRLENWSREKGARILHWREVRTRARYSHFYSGADNPRTQERAIHAGSCCQLQQVLLCRDLPHFGVLCSGPLQVDLTGLAASGQRIVGCRPPPA